MQNDPLIRPLRPLIKMLEDQAVAADWEGDRATRDRLMRLVAAKRELLNAGEEFEVMF